MRELIAHLFLLIISEYLESFWLVIVKIRFFEKVKFFWVILVKILKCNRLKRINLIVYRDQENFTLTVDSILENKSNDENFIYNFPF